jgi:hypothetical protein
MYLVYLSTDELNRSLVQWWGGQWGIEVECPEGVDRAWDGSCDGVLLDLDHATAEWIGTLAMLLGTARGTCPQKPSGPTIRDQSAEVCTHHRGYGQPVSTAHRKKRN